MNEKAYIYLNNIKRMSYLKLIGDCNFGIINLSFNFAFLTLIVFTLIITMNNFIPIIIGVLLSIFLLFHIGIKIQNLIANFKLVSIFKNLSFNKNKLYFDD